MLKKINDYCLIYLSTKRFLKVHEENDCYATEGKVIDSTFLENFLEKIKNLESSDICRLYNLTTWNSWTIHHQLFLQTACVTERLLYQRLSYLDCIITSSQNSCVSWATCFNFLSNYSIFVPENMDSNFNLQSNC